MNSLLKAPLAIAAAVLLAGPAWVATGPAWAATVIAAPPASVASSPAAPQVGTPANVLGAPQTGPTLARIRRSGMLVCGVVHDDDDISEADTHGNVSTLGADYCRAMAAEIFGDARRARFLTSSDEPAALRALRDHRTDVLFGATPNPVLGAVYHVAYGPPILIDGQGFLVANRLGMKSIDDLAGRNVCFINASPPEQILYDALEPRLKQRENRFPYSERGEMEIALLDGHCDAITGDISWMANVRVSFNKRAKDFSILPGTISTDPLSPAYRSDDPQWSALVDWTVWAAEQAEAHGLSHDSVGAAGQSTDPVVRRLVGTTPWIGRALGIADDGFARAIAAVGNAGEIYERDLGTGSSLQLPRGQSALAGQGGLLWALPVEPLQ
ncbi:hypothetical protein [Lichenicola sp.]|uniref:hypothetical protein n=1 Tax=Lichenicola sp. TaxID=2804529 RepID=UPI003B00D053